MITATGSICYSTLMSQYYEDGHGSSDTTLLWVDIAWKTGHLLLNVAYAMWNDIYFKALFLIYANSIYVWK